MKEPFLQKDYDELCLRASHTSVRFQAELWRHDQPIFITPGVVELLERCPCDWMFEVIQGSQTLREVVCRTRQLWCLTRSSADPCPEFGDAVPWFDAQLTCVDDRERDIMLVNQIIPVSNVSVDKLPLMVRPSHNPYRLHISLPSGHT